MAGWPLRRTTTSSRCRAAVPASVAAEEPELALHDRREAVGAGQRVQGCEPEERAAVVVEARADRAGVQRPELCGQREREVGVGRAGG
jgi:hypothetical protein